MLFKVPFAAGGKIIKDRRFLYRVQREQVVDYMASDEARASDDEEAFPTIYFKPSRQPALAEGKA